MTDSNRNKQIVRNHFEALNRRDIDAVVACLSPNIINHSAVPEARRGPEAVRTILTKLVKAMPDHSYTCEDVIAEEDRVMCRVTLRGTQTGSLDFPRMALPATGRAVETEQIHIFRLEHDKIVEHWLGRDDMGFLRQLGHLPFASTPPTPTPTPS